MSLYFHATSPERAEAILGDGFRDGHGSYLTTDDSILASGSPMRRWTRMRVLGVAFSSRLKSGMTW